MHQEAILLQKLKNGVSEMFKIATTIKGGATGRRMGVMSDVSGFDLEFDTREEAEAYIEECRARTERLRVIGVPITFTQTYEVFKS